MTTVALQAHMKPTSKVVNHPDTLFLPDSTNLQVYENRPQSIAELKVAITQKIRAVRKEECIRVIDNFARRFQVCLQRNGGHLEHVL